MKIKELLKSNTFRISSITIMIMLAILLVFELGVFVGGRQCNFSKNYEKNYFRNFIGQENFMENKNNVDTDPFNRPPNPHGILGTIIKISDGNVVIKDGVDDVEKIVLITNKTIIKNGKNTIKISDLKVDEKIVIIGNPNDNGNIEAAIIRIVNQSQQENLKNNINNN